MTDQTPSILPLSLDHQRETQALWECLTLSNSLVLTFGRSHPELRSLMLRLTWLLRHRSLTSGQRSDLDQLIRVLNFDLKSGLAQSQEILRTHS